MVVIYSVFLIRASCARWLYTTHVNSTARVSTILHLLYSTTVPGPQVGLLLSQFTCCIPMHPKPSIAQLSPTLPQPHPTQTQTPQHQPMGCEQYSTSEKFKFSLLNNVVPFVSLKSHPEQGAKIISKIHAQQVKDKCFADPLSKEPSMVGQGRVPKKVSMLIFDLHTPWF